MPNEKELLFFRMLSAFTSTPLSPENYVLGLPVDQLIGTVNTSITLKPKIASNEYFDRTLGYNRAQLDVVSIIGVIKGGATDLYGLLGRINQEPIFEVVQKDGPFSDYYTVPGVIYEDDVFNAPIPAHGMTDYVDVPMFATPTALFIKGSLVVRVFK